MVSLLIKDVLKYVSMEHGAQFVMTIGGVIIQKLCVDNWDIVLMVSQLYLLFFLLPIFQLLTLGG